MKKIIALVLSLVMVFALAACGSGGTAATAAPATDTDTVAVGAVVIARDDVSSDDVYAFVSTIFDNIAAIGEQHGKGKELDMAFASGITSVPYHPGAAKYFSEKGLTVPVK